MKKLFLILALSALAITGCNKKNAKNSDNSGTTDPGTSQPDGEQSTNNNQQSGDNNQQQGNNNQQQGGNNDQPTAPSNDPPQVVTTQHHGTFTSVGGQITQNDGYVGVTLVCGETDSINVTMKNATVSNDSVTVQKDSYFIIYNNQDSPLNDIANLACQWTHESALENQESLGFALYFSYNFLILDDIMAGRYADLQTHIGTFPVQNASYSFNSSQANMSAPNARYFLAIIETPSKNLTLNNFSVASNSETAPEAVAIGEFTYPNIVTNTFVGFENGFPFIGNGSFTFRASNPAIMTALQPVGKYQIMVNYFTSNGFVKVTENYGFDIYQKLYQNGQYYTYGLQYYMAAGMELITIYYLGLQTSMEKVTEWPEDVLKEGFADQNFKNQITNPNLSGNVSYVAGYSIESNEIRSYVMINCEDNTRDQYATNCAILENYFNNFVSSYGYQIVYKSPNSVNYNQESFSFSGYAKSSDFKHQVYVSFDYNPMYPTDNGLMINFVEKIFGEFPSNDIRELYEDNNFPVLNSANGIFNSEINDSISVLALNVLGSEIEAYYDALEAYGFLMNDTDFGTYIQYTGTMFKFTGTSGFNYYVALCVYPDRVEMNFQKYESQVITSFTSAVSNVMGSSLSSEFAEAVDYGEGEFIYDYISGTIYCLNANQSKADQILSVTTFDPIINKNYYVDQNNPDQKVLIVDVDVNNGYLVLSLDTIAGETWSDYYNASNATVFANQIDTYFNDLSITEDIDAYHFSGENVKFTLNEYMDTLYVYSPNIVQTKEALANSLLLDTNIHYSHYYDAYINDVNGVGVRFNLLEDARIPFIQVSFYFSMTYIEYLRYDELDFTPFAHLDKFPSLENITDGIGFILDYAGTDSVELTVSQDVFDAYLEIVENDASFTYNDEEEYFVKTASDGTQTFISFDESLHTIGFDYFVENAESISDIVSGYSLIDIIASSALPQTDVKAFNIINYEQDSAYISFDQTLFDETKVNEYKEYLLSQGYVLTKDLEGRVCYAKHSGTDEYIVRITNFSIYLNRYSFTNTSRVNMEDDLSLYDFDIVRLDNFVNASVDDCYALLTISHNDFTLLIRSDAVTVDAYKNSLISAGYTLNNNSYVKGTTTVEVSECFGYVFIHYSDNRIIYKTISEVVQKAVETSSLRSWIFEYVPLPEQAGSIYALEDTNDHSMTFNYSDDFDLDAYKAFIEGKGFAPLYEGSEWYELEDGYADVIFDENNKTIELRYYGNPYTTDYYFNSWLNDQGLSYSEDISLPDVMKNRQLDSYSTSLGMNDEHFCEFSFYYYDSLENDEEDIVLNNDLVTWYLYRHLNNQGFLYIYDLDTTDTRKLSEIFDDYYIDLSSYAGYDEVKDITLTGYFDFYKDDSLAQDFSKIQAFLSSISESLLYYNYNSSDESIEFSYSDSNQRYVIRKVSESVINIYEYWVE